MKKLILLSSLLLVNSSIALAKKPDQNYVIGTGILLSMIKLPGEIFWAMAKPFRMHEYNKRKEEAIAKKDKSLEGLSCEEKCVNDFRNLAQGRERTFPESGADLLSFLNEKSDFADHIQRTVGYCWGHTSVTRNFAYLSFYDPEQKLEKAPSEEDEKAFKRFYDHKIKKIMKGKAQIIPGFSSTREFSSHPLIKTLFKDAVVWNWADKALKVRSVGVSFRGKKGLMEAEEVNSFVSEIKERLSYNHVPKVFFTNLKKSGFIHVVNVFDVREDESSFKLCILDNHMYEDKLKDCGVYVSVKKDGTENYYEGWNDPKRGLEGLVGQIGFTPEDKVEILRFSKQNHKMCLKLCNGQSNTEEGDED